MTKTEETGIKQTLGVEEVSNDDFMTIFMAGFILGESVTRSITEEEGGWDKEAIYERIKRLVQRYAGITPPGHNSWSEEQLQNLADWYAANGNAIATMLMHHDSPA